MTNTEWNNFEEINRWNQHEADLLKQIDAHEQLTAAELSELVEDCGIETTYEENNHFYQTAYTTIKLADRYFTIEWQEALSHVNENIFEEQPVEVKQFDEIYWKNFEGIALHKIDAKEELESIELSELVSLYEVDRSYETEGHWSNTIHSIVKLADRYFLIEWDEDTTECGEDEFVAQPIEVLKEEVQQTITVVNWVEK